MDGLVLGPFLLAALERFPVGVNRDSQGRWKGRIFGSDSPFGGEP
jgi:hypothetical protein